MTMESTSDSEGGVGRVLIFDTTLRDGEQSPGCSMSLPEKLRVAEALDRLGVDIIEAGFPIASPGDFESVRAVSRVVENAVVCGLARCQSEDIDRAWEAVKDANRSRIHVFLATSAIHREHKLGMACEEIVRRSVEGVERAKALTTDIEFSPEDAARTEPEFLAEVVEAVIAAGATTVNIPDTVGYTTPTEFADLFTYLWSNVRGIDGVTLSVHCHDDLGMAVANSLAAVRAGARQIECTVNGIGERAGNAALEEVAMALRTRTGAFGADTGIDTARLCAVSRLVAAVTGSVVPRNKAIVGRNAFAHEAGIHQHGVLKHSATYEIMRPEDVGFQAGTLVLGKHSGKHAIRDRIEQLGYGVSDEQLSSIMTRFKLLADRKKEVFDADIEALVLGLELESDGPWTLASLSTSGGTDPIQTATVGLENSESGARVVEAAVGDGPIDAMCKATARAVGMPALTIKEYRAKSVTGGEDAQGEVIVAAEASGRLHRGRGLSTDVIEATAHAIVDIVNQASRFVDADRGTDHPVASASEG